MCVATEYGEVLLDGIPDIEIRAGRMDAEEMRAFFAGERFTRILDATHPYAERVTENIREAADSLGIPVTRILRDCDGFVPGAEYVPSVEAASVKVAFLPSGHSSPSPRALLAWSFALPEAS